MKIVYFFLIERIKTLINPIKKYTNAIAKQENFIVAIIAAMGGAIAGIAPEF